MAAAGAEPEPAPACPGTVASGLALAQGDC